MPVPYLPESAPFSPVQRDWLNAYFARLFSQHPSGDGHLLEAVPPVPSERYDRRNPFPARLLACTPLVAGSDGRDIRHVVLSLEGSGLTYRPGDALGVIPANDPELAMAIVDVLGCSPGAPVQLPSGASGGIFEALCDHYEIGAPPRKLLEAVAVDAELKRILEAESKEAMAGYLSGRDVLDVLMEQRVQMPADAFVALLRPLQHRLYSISSSLSAHPGEVHLTVGVVRYEARGRTRGGVCSTYLPDRAAVGATVPIFVHENRAFRLPDDPATPIIMVGPGTGIAPFRAFLEERRATQGAGPAWLFFGNRHAAEDFLYEAELAEMKADGTLTRLDTAFSRDQPTRIYVQDRMLERGTDLYAWLEEGAHVYVCGDASRMAKDVDSALCRVVEVASGVTPDEAAAYIRRLRREKRYVRDVY